MLQFFLSTHIALRVSLDAKPEGGTEQSVLIAVTTKFFVANGEPI